MNALFRSGLCLLALLTVTASAAWAQTTVISGRVTDPDRAVVAGAGVTLIDIQSGSQLSATTSTEGTFRFADLTPGRYLLQIVRPGFGTYTEDIDAGPGEHAIEAGLQVAALTEQVTVRGIATLPSIGRTAVPLKDQPITVNTVTAEQMASQGVNDLVTALQFVNNVNAYQSYGVYESYQFRGFGDVVQMVDGVRTEGNRVRSQMSNVEAVEVLKGPASVLYGSDSIGATMNIVLKKPSPQPAYDFSTSIGSFKTYRGTFGATGRVGAGNRLLYRVDLGVEDADNFRHDAWNRLNVTPSMTVRLGQTDRLDIRYALNRNDLSGDPGVPLVTRPDGSSFVADVPRDRRFSTPQDFALSNDHNLRGSYGHTFRNGIGIRNISAVRLVTDEYWETETLRVVYPSTVTRQFLYFKHRRRPVNNQMEFSGPVRFLVNHDFLAGWDHQTYPTRTTRVESASVLTAPIDLYNPVETHITRTEFPPSRYDYTTNFTNAVYLQDHLTLGPQLKAVAGIRLDNVRRYQHNNPIVNGLETEVPRVRRDSHKATERVGLVYQPLTRLDIYGQYATAFQPNFNLQPDGTPLEPTYGVSFEVGQRLRLKQDRVNINTAVFEITKRNVAFSRPGGFFEQVGKVRSRGFEADMHARVSPSFNFTLGYGYTDAVYVDYISTLTTDFSGHHPPRVPPHTVTAQAVYTWNNTLSLMAGTQYRDAQFLNDQNTLTLDGFQLANVAATYYYGAMQVNFAVSNLTDAFYYSGIRGNTQFYPGESRRYQLTARWNIR